MDLCEYAHKIIPKIHLMAGEAMTEKGMTGKAMTEKGMAGEAV